jgi:FtsH-binding integral membrane protein
MKPDPWIYIEPKPDKAEIVIRAICSFLFSVLVGGYFSVRMLRYTDAWIVLAIFVAFVAGFTYGATKLGDRFWWGFFRWMR